MRVIVETERLRLRELCVADADLVLRLNANPNVVKYVGEAPLIERAQALAILTERILPQYRLHGAGRWAVELKGDGTFVGWCGLKRFPDPREWDLGYRFLEEQWGRGYATEAARATLDWARLHLPGERIVGKAMLDNLASIRVLEKIGLRFEGRGHDHGGEIAIYVR